MSRTPYSAREEKITGQILAPRSECDAVRAPPPAGGAATARARPRPAAPRRSARRGRSPRRPRRGPRCRSRPRARPSPRRPRAGARGPRASPAPAGGRARRTPGRPDRSGGSPGGGPAPRMWPPCRPGRRGPRQAWRRARRPPAEAGGRRPGAPARGAAPASSRSAGPPRRRRGRSSRRPGRASAPGGPPRRSRAPWPRAGSRRRRSGVAPWACRVTEQSFTIDRMDRIALVAGGTRGAGRGIATELGAAGWTVYVTGRSTRAGRSAMNRPETIEETAERVGAAGGRGVPVHVDHADPDQVRALVARIEAEAGRLDLLVNDIWGGDPLTRWGVPFWEHALDDGLALLRQAVETHLITSHAAAPLLIRTGGGLVVEMTDGVEDAYRGGFFYDVAKATVIRAARGMAEDLRPHGVAAVAPPPRVPRPGAGVRPPRRPPG